MLGAALITAFLETLGFGAQPMMCRFPPDGPDASEINIEIAPRPSLRDLPGLFRIRMTLNDATEFPGAAQPITTTPDRDILVRARGEDATFYTVGLNDQGMAAFNVLWTQPENEDVTQITRTGTCRNHERYFAQWLGE